MRIVPENRLLIQPTVQLKWIEQHGTIEFQISLPLQTQFLSIWSEYLKSGSETLHQFLNRNSTLDKELFNDDPLFALLVGADYILKNHPSLVCFSGEQNLVWSI